MNPALIALGIAAVAMLGSSQRKPDMRAPKPDFVRNRQIVRAEALRQGVPVEVALGTVRLESNFDATHEGDRNWHLNRERFERAVPETNPHRAEPELWHSYGLFQLLAPYHVRDNEDPRVLLDPAINTERGISTLRRLLLDTHSDLDLVRLRYTGAIRADASTQARVLASWQKALKAERALL